jgi:hypothetical protein
LTHQHRVPIIPARDGAFVVLASRRPSAQRDCSSMPLGGVCRRISTMEARVIRFAGRDGDHPRVEDAIKGSRPRFAQDDIPVPLDRAS